MFEEEKEIIQRLYGKGQSNGVTNNLDKFFIKQYESHKWMFDLWGGFNKTFTIPSSSSKEPYSIPATIKDDFVYKLNILLPTFFSTYGLGRGIFESPKLISNKRDFTLTKHITTFASRIPGTNLGAVNDLTTAIGQVFKQYKNTADNDYLTLSIDPFSFLNLGNYGYDSNSCFHYRGMNRDKRYTIATHPESCILAISSDKPEYKDRIISNSIVRMIGFINRDFNYLAFCNSYVQKKIAKYNFYSAIKYILPEISNKKYQQFSDDYNDIKFKGGINYNNGSYVNFSTVDINLPLIFNFDFEYSMEFHHSGDPYADRK